MGEYVVILVCSLGALLLHMLHHAYFYLPLKEMKRRASHGKKPFKNLLLVAKYDASTHVFFDFCKFTLTVSAFVAIADTLAPLYAGLSIFALIIIFSYAGRVNSRIAVGMAAALSTYFEPVIRKLEPVLSPIGRLMRSPVGDVRTDIYEKDDLKELLQRQKNAPNNRIHDEELTRALYALEFGSKKIRDYMIGYDDIHFVTTKEPIGPILLSELHKSGYQSFPVQGNAAHEVVGMLHMNHLAEHTSGGTVGSVMESTVHYVSESEYLDYIIEMFAQTGAHIYMVTNAASEVIGLIGIDDILAQLLGHAIDRGVDDEDLTETEE